MDRRFKVTNKQDRQVQDSFMAETAEFFKKLEAHKPPNQQRKNKSKYSFYGRKNYDFFRGANR
jgi:hypothetical protein